MKVIKRLLHEPTHSAPHSAPRLSSDNALAPPTQLPQDKKFVLTYADLLSSLPQIPPSALRSLALPVLPTHWSTLGGRTIDHIRQKLTEAITWPLTHPDSFARFGVQPPRGVLLYGPPGCSKTMVGRALATESGVNFLAVRGPEVGFWIYIFSCIPRLSFSL
jgi:AAA family ATPase